ncbi:MAG: Immunoglobulin I-set domain protein, partial [Pedosphaera sp.]|nr:Immunoglobulin I-set domain protein [Pedosphaera sp.]
FGTNDFADSANDLYVAVIGSDTRAGNFVTYTLTGSTNGYNITNIVTTGGWNDGGRDQQAYTVYYANVAHPTTFLPLASVNCNPVNPSGISIDRATIKPVTGSLAANVVALKFDYTSPAGENGYSGYSEIGVFGAPSAPYAAPTPPILSASAVSGGNLVVTGTGGTPNRAYAWLTSTDLTIPVANWTVSSTGVLDSTGALSNAIPISTSTPASFFRLWMP